MKTILVLGAGRSSGCLIKYLNEQAAEGGWTVTLADVDRVAAEQKAAGFETINIEELDFDDAAQADRLIASADAVISLLPPSMHTRVARRCLTHRKHLITASYVDDAMAALDGEAKAADLLFLNECGLDPGIDHLSGMKIMDEIRDAGHELIAFETFTGGLLAPNPDANPWDYKFTWNPRNVVLAGQGHVRFIQQAASSTSPTIDSSAGSK